LIESRWKKYLALHSWGQRLPFVAFLMNLHKKVGNVHYTILETLYNKQLKMCSKIHLGIGRKVLENCYQKQTFTSSFYLSQWFVVAYFTIRFLELLGSWFWNLNDLIGTWNMINVHDVLGRIMEEKALELFLCRTNYWQWNWTTIVGHKDFRNILENRYWTIPWQ
jgi:hypothetical protein